MHKNILTCFILALFFCVPSAVMATEGIKESKNIKLLDNYTVSFNCNEAKGCAETTICANPYLGQLDGVLSQVYKNRLGNDKNLIRQQQREWLRERNACTSEDCIALTYRKRIGDLCEMPIAYGVSSNDICESLSLMPGAALATGQENENQYTVPRDNLKVLEIDFKNCFRDVSNLVKVDNEFFSPIHQGGSLVNCAYFESGRFKETPFRNGKKRGVARIFSESGRLIEEISCRNDKKEGQVKIHRGTGKLFTTILYRANSPISGICHHTNGTATPLTNAELANFERGFGIECN